MASGHYYLNRYMKLNEISLSRTMQGVARALKPRAIIHDKGNNQYIKFMPINSIYYPEYDQLIRLKESDLKDEQKNIIANVSKIAGFFQNVNSLMKGIVCRYDHTAGVITIDIPPRANQEEFLGRLKGLLCRSPEELQEATKNTYEYRYTLAIQLTDSPKDAERLARKRSTAELEAIISTSEETIRSIMEQTTANISATATAAATAAAAAAAEAAGAGDSKEHEVPRSR